MSVEHICFEVEEPSMEKFLRVVLPRLLGEISFEVFGFRSKEELLQHLPARLKGYSAWLPDTYRVVVVVDRDDDDCHQLKAKLESFAAAANLPTRSNPSQGRFAVVNRIAIEELEAWYFGDWNAVRAAYPRVSPHVPRKQPYRDPDAIAGGAWEAFERVLRSAGYFKTGLRKIEAAESIAPHLDHWRNSSHSFQVFRDVLVEIATP